MIKVSIIIPIYNVEKYISKCLESIISIFFKDFEVIIVNDGSTDNSSIIGQEYADKYDNFYLYHKENGGLSSARNLGIKYAKGKYIYFLDSDDYLDIKIFRELLETALDKNLDCISFNYNTVTEKGIVKKQKNKYNCIEDIIYLGGDFLSYFTIYPMVPLYIMKRTIFNDFNLSFCDGIYHEDELFTPIFISKCKSILFSDKAPYNYLQRANSIAHSKNNIYKKYLDIIFVISELFKYRNSFDNESSTYKGITKRIEYNILDLEIKILRQKNINKKELTDSLYKIIGKNFKFNNVPLKHKLAHNIISKYFLLFK